MHILCQPCILGGLTRPIHATSSFHLLWVSGDPLLCPHLLGFAQSSPSYSEQASATLPLAPCASPLAGYMFIVLILWWWLAGPPPDAMTMDLILNKVPCFIPMAGMQYVCWAGRTWATHLTRGQVCVQRPWPWTASLQQVPHSSMPHWQ